MFYVKGVDITNDKQMFNFLKGHLEYPTMNSWNRLYSIANNVKLYNLGLSGDWGAVLALLENGEYDSISWMIQDWCREHVGYKVYFNGRSGGYLVLKEDDTSCGALPDFITDCDTYDDYKDYCKEYYGSVKANRSDLVYYVKLVQDFDKLCDTLRDYCEELSKLKFEVIEMVKSVDRFNDEYADDLELLGFDYLRCSDDGSVDVQEISAIKCLIEAFSRIADRSNSGYELQIDNNTVKLISSY